VLCEREGDHGRSWALCVRMKQSKRKRREGGGWEPKAWREDGEMEVRLGDNT
jgi:hypothetical protein